MKYFFIAIGIIACSSCIDKRLDVVGHNLSNVESFRKVNFLRKNYENSTMVLYNGKEISFDKFQKKSRNTKIKMMEIVSNKQRIESMTNNKDVKYLIIVAS